MHASLNKADINKVFQSNFQIINNSIAEHEYKLNRHKKKSLWTLLNKNYNPIKLDDLRLFVLLKKLK